MIKMLNQVVIAGRLVNDPQVEENDDRKVTTITVAVPRSYKNIDGEYETDFITCTLWNSIAESTAEYCKKGDIVGVKGRIQTTTVDDKTTMTVIAEKVSFLSSRRSEED